MGNILSHAGMLVIGILVGYVGQGVIKTGVYVLIQYLQSRKDR